ncbi:MAG: hypothetical protein KDD48_05780 [Bdellovibrionales bacterium]|nr:hypothetical protein [Bdellovibrionales bacterium]
MSFSLVFSEEALTNGLITASQVDVTADDGSLLPDRMNVGDIVYIVTKPSGGKKDGWVRISRSPDDKLGFGWVEKKYIRTFSNYKDPSGGSQSATASLPDSFESSPDTSMGSSPDIGLPDELAGIPFIPEDNAGSNLSQDSFGLGSMTQGTSKHNKVGILKFNAQTNDQFVGKIFDEFSQAVTSSGSLSSSIINDNVKSESEGALQKITNKKNLDGVFVGTVSDPLDNGRLVQVRFYSGKDKKFLFEKVTRIPLGGDSKGMIDTFVKSILDQLNNPI